MNISLAARVCLVNLILTGLPLYMMSFFKMPKQVVHKIERIQRKFIWGTKEGSSKIH
uniref:Uncharacterized protein n=1 Tax=Cajanus cajan TaxID=3821 RepID=A0A151RHA7_CAJCA|nr:hypothetical protein KK1_036618 [Cajanus cajan]